MKANPPSKETDFALNALEQARIDSLKTHQPEATPKIHPFNPDYITDHKGYTLGLSASQLDRLFAFRKKDWFVNSAKGFQNVTQISDSLLNEISPYFKFPDWVKNNRTATKKESSVKKTSTIKELNSAMAEELTSVYGMGLIGKKSQIQG